MFLFDEPLSNLDAKLRGSTRREILLLHKRLGATMLYVTHDQTEALTLADRIVCMSMGHVQQVGTPLELYDSPANLFVASFIGLPPMNFFDVMTYNLLNAAILGVTGETGTVPLGVGPILFGLFYMGYDMLFLGMKRLFSRIVSDARRQSGHL